MRREFESPTDQSRGNIKTTNASDYNTASDGLPEFKQAMLAAGINYDGHINDDGQLHRFTVSGDKPSTNTGWYVYYSGNISAGAFGCWKRGISEKWCSKSRHEMSGAERQAYQSHMAQLRRQRQDILAQQHGKARQRAAYIWDRSFIPTTHPYLVAKNVKPYGIKLSGDALVIPLADTDGLIHSLQFINPNGNKRMLSGGAKAGHFHLIGTVADTLLICEGYSTGATLHEHTGHAVAVAVDAGNLKAVGQALRAKYPTIKLIYCADNDQYSKVNVGVIKATEAAQCTTGYISIPEFTDLSTKPTDFNDLAALQEVFSV